MVTVSDNTACQSSVWRGRVQIRVWERVSMKPIVPNLQLDRSLVALAVSALRPLGNSQAK